MRTRTEIEDANQMPGANGTYNFNDPLLLEVLLDIRDLLTPPITPKDLQKAIDRLRGT